MIHKSERFDNYPHKTTFFRSVIELFHRTHGNITDLQELKKINRETIQYLLNELYPPPVPPPPKNTPFREEPHYRTKEEEQEKKREIYNLAFEEKQRQYQLLQLKPAIPEVNFLEKLDDEPLTNIDELVEKQRKEREQEYSMHFPLVLQDETKELKNHIIYEIEPLSEKT
jgi:hypothetical protein